MIETFLTQKEFDQKYHEMRESNAIKMSKTKRVAFTVVSTNEKFILNDATRMFHNPIIDKQQKMLAGKAVKLHLRHFYKPIQTSLKQRKLRINAPMFYSGKYTARNLVYFDLTSAYYQIYSRLWLDVKWPRGRGSQPLSLIGKKLYSWKTARNAVAGFTYSNSFALLKPGTVKKIVYTKQPFFNPAIWYTCNYFLHELSNIALRLGCCYVATDGFLFPNGAKWELFSDTLKMCELEFKRIVGTGDISNWQSYRIRGLNLQGNLETKCTNPFLSSFLENPLENYSPESIRSEVKKRTMRIDKVKKLQIDKFSDCGIITWWQKLPRN